MWPEWAPVGVAHPRVACLLAAERCRDVTLAVTGGDEHQRQRNQLTMSLADKRGHGLGHRWPRKLDEATCCRTVRGVMAALQPLHERLELRDSSVASGPVSHYQQR